jgi:GMP synthase (glutamine-hydrolysing)
MSARFLVIKTGKTYDGIKERYGCFDDWMAAGLGVPRDRVDVASVFEGEDLPAHFDDYSGLVITGSPAMVTDRLPWSEALADRLAGEIAGNPDAVPVLGICYGHQLLAHALGGDVAYNPRGREIGTVTITLTDAHRGDALFSAFAASATFDAHVTHLQSVIRLPPGSVHLAASALEPHHAFRAGERVWGVQFHPEFTEDVMRAYIDVLDERMRAEGIDADWVRNDVHAAPASNSLLRRFAVLAASLRRRS